MLRDRVPSLAELPETALIRAEDVARYLGCSRDTVRRAGVPWVAITPRVKRYRVGDLKQWIASRVQGAA